jgi:glycosyltransferase involved in cell wall biosynthesis
MDRIYSAADLLVVPSYKEAFGQSLVEALIKGVPCVASGAGNQAWIIGDAGHCVPPGDVEALCQAIRSVIAHYPAVQRRAMLRGHQLREAFSWDRIARRILRELRRHLAGGQEGDQVPPAGRGRNAHQTTRASGTPFQT